MFDKYTVYEAACDGTGCLKTAFSTLSTKKEAALAIKSMGWYMEDMHLCPECNIRIFPTHERT